MVTVRSAFQRITLPHAERLRAQRNQDTRIRNSNQSVVIQVCWIVRVRRSAQTLHQQLQVINVHPVCRHSGRQDSGQGGQLGLRTPMLPE